MLQSPPQPGAGVGSPRPVALRRGRGRGRRYRRPAPPRSGSPGKAGSRRGAGTFRASRLSPLKRGGGARPEPPRLLSCARRCQWPRKAACSQTCERGLGGKQRPPAVSPPARRGQRQCGRSGEPHPRGSCTRRRAGLRGSGAGASAASLKLRSLQPPYGGLLCHTPRHAPARWHLYPAVEGWEQPRWV